MSNCCDASGGLGVVTDAAGIAAIRRDAGAVRLFGDLDVAGIAVVRGVVEGVEGDVEVDCSDLTFLDASGLGFLVAVHRACVARGARLVIVNPSPCVARLLALTDLDVVLADRADAPVSSR